MPKHVREKCGILSISSIVSYKRGITPTKLTQIDDTLTWSVEQSNIHMQNFSSICQSMYEQSAENCVFSVF